MSTYCLIINVALNIEYQPHKVDDFRDFDNSERYTKSTAFEALGFLQFSPFHKQLIFPFVTNPGLCQ
jgi:hypothetical protein